MAPRLLRLALAAASGVAAASGASAEDAAALLQVNAAVGQKNDGDDFMDLVDNSTQETWDCRCLNWKTVYQSKLAECGSGEEFEFLGKHRYHYPGLVSDMCTRFFQQYDDNHCIQRFFDTRARDEWCYVGPQCKSKPGQLVFAAKGGAVNWKVCGDAKDRTLREESPTRLLRIAEWTGMDPAYLMKMAYPVWDTRMPGFHWPGAQEALGIREEHGKLQEKKDYLHSVQQLGQPWILDSYDGHPPYGLVWGKKIIECKFSPWYFEHLRHLPDLWEDQKRISKFVCVAGCDLPKPEFHGERDENAAPADWYYKK